MSCIKTFLIATILLQLCFLGAIPSQATDFGPQHPEIKATQQSALVEKKSFSLPSFTTVGGKTIKNVQVGWESYGTLNKDKSNVILITHFFAGTSHAAGKYSADDELPGYWDTIIGPGKAVDTDKFFVISCDTLVNLNAKDPRVITTGPSSINPDTGQRYGMDFPIVTMCDFVNVQKALLESLGIKKLHTVMGASMGAMQAFEWATSYPEMVERVISVVGAAQANDWLIAWFDISSDLIRQDPEWNKGDYYGHKEPVTGLKSALKMMTLQAGSPLNLDLHRREWTDHNKNPLDNFDNTFKVETTLKKISEKGAEYADANHFLYLAKASQLFSINLDLLKAPVLLLPAETDILLPPVLSEKILDTIKNGVELVTMKGTYGHLGFIFSINQVALSIKSFLNREQ